jgi:photosystem II stability/assembly factor-like uncharacterized protein
MNRNCLKTNQLMGMRTSKNILSGILAALVLMLGWHIPASAQRLAPEIVNKVNYRNIGPTRQGGRYVDFAVVESNPTTFYTATASGGLWKTENNGTSFFPIFDNESVISIGAVAVSQSNPDQVWVGTGEANNSRSSYWGDGIYKSTDAGKTWTNVGLPNSGHIGRVLIHPTNPDIVYVAALGHLYSDNEERGLYKTTDGGKTWSKVLSVFENNKHIGVVEAIMHPTNPDVLIAAAYDKIRTPWTFNEGGPGSAIYRSTDAGKTWTKLEGGLPTGFLGRIGLGYSQSNPNVVYANVENVNVDGVSFSDRLRQLTIGIAPEGRVKGMEMWRSDDGGDTWRKVSPDGQDVGGGPGYYYAQMAINPTDPDHVYVLGVRMWETRDGGKTWGRPFAFGGDNHCMWINKNNPRHIMLGYDHGMGISYDEGKTWYHPDELPLAQFYAINVDMDYPYNVYGGLQDNGSVKGPSTRRSGGPIRLEDWKTTGGGDGMVNVVDPTDSRWLYNESQFGVIQRVDQKTGERKSIRHRDNDMRWNWMSPIMISPHDPTVIYHAGNRLLRSPHRGEFWEYASPDLSNNDPVKQAGTGNIQYGTITTIDESIIQRGQLWAGTDDGNVWVTLDGGENWQKLNDNIKGNPGYWVSRVIASAHNNGTAYVTYTGYRHDDFRPFIYKTTDFGKTWTDIKGNLPNEPINVVREDPRNPNLLFVGTEMAIHVSIDGGANWTRMKGNMPTNAVHDMVIHPREFDLVVGTHGRSAFIADVSWMHELTAANLAKNAHLFPVRRKIRWVNTGENHSPYTNFRGESEPAGMPIRYYLKDNSTAPVKISIFRGERLVYEIDAPKSKGVNEVQWGMVQRTRERNDREKAQVRQQIERMRGFGMGEDEIANFMGSMDMDYVTEPAPEGHYRVVLTVGNSRMETTAQIMRDYWYDKP